LTLAELEIFEKLLGQLEGLHREIGALAKKSSTDAVNAFKLRFVNSIIAEADVVLGKKYKPFVDFHQFDSDDVPSNSDVTMIITQYIEAFERLRADNVQFDYDGWYYALSDGPKNIKTAPPRRLSEKRS
jgi:hypothetical protein